MAMNGLVVGLLVIIVFGLVLTPLMIVCWYAVKGDIKSSYNYRPKSAQVDFPEDVKTKMNNQCDQMACYRLVAAFFCAMIIGWGVQYSIGQL